ncbi:MAG TPA: orotidine-5'-phosphate decarboxylase [Luteibaculaceae bacterium]|nr:orotidine-5'-phosphate decarboxylase [Luteibaculaceae bacterium]
MTRSQLIALIKERKSFLCVGLDTDLTKIPAKFLETEDPIFEFNKAIIDATADYCVAYKPNLAFYECHGAKGWESLEKTIAYIGDTHFTIADAKRGDIGNTSSYYAKTFFEVLGCDSVTIAPYMGKDSVEPFLKFDGKWAILLALTSNEGAVDFQFQSIAPGSERLYEKVLKLSQSWGNTGNLMYVVGATRPEMLSSIRQIIPDHFLLVPGVGAQGGSLTEVCKYGLTPDVGLLINASRSIIYAGAQESNFETHVEKAAAELQSEMAQILTERGIC